MIYWAGLRAQDTQRPNLNLSVYIRWLGTSGMIWQGLRSKLQMELLCRVAPTFLLIHLGGNNIGDTNIGHLCRLIKTDLSYIAELLPDCLVIWSDILPRLHWLHAGTASNIQLDMKRRRINRHGRQIICSFPNGRYIGHDISKDSPDLFQQDGIHLSDTGNDIFLNTLQGGIETFLKSSSIQGFP